MIHHICILSDIHYSLEDKNSKVILDRATKLGSAVYSALNRSTMSLLIVVNGDIADQGNEKEFDQMSNFFEILNNYLHSKMPELSIKYIVTPGNHDCNFSVYNSVDERKNLISKMNDQDFFLKHKEEYEKKLSNFKQFKNSISILDATIDDTFFSTYKINNNGHLINILAFNSVIYFDHVYNNDRMIIDENVFDKLFLDKDSIVLSFTHYPMEWLERENNDFHLKLRQKSNIVFFSHEHRKDHNYVRDSNDHVSYDFRLPVFYDKNNHQESGFFIMKIDEETSCFTIREYYLNDDIYIKSFSELSDSIKKTFKPTQSLVSIDKQYFDSFMRANFILTHYDIECIDDLFVSPTIGIPFIDELDQDYYEYIDFENYTFNESDLNTIFVFSESYGKTTMLKHLFKEAYYLGYIPIYVKIDSTNKAVERIKKAIDNFIQDLYGSSDIVEQKKDKVILFIDQLSALTKNTVNVLNALEDRGYFKIIATFDEKEYQFDLVEWDYSKIEYYKVFKFGHSQKYDLIEKWVDVSKFKDLDEIEKNQKIASIKELLDNTDNRLNFINTPEMILIFLDAYEDNRSDSLLINGSKGVFYKFLFSKYILNLATVSEVEMPFVERFLEAYAYKSFMNEDSSFTDFSNNFIDDNMIEPEYYYDCVKKIKSSMKKMNLTRDDAPGDIDFTFRQFQSYLIAQHYVEKFEEKQKEVLDLTDRLYDDDVANIILFIFNRNRSLLLIDKIIKMANDIFTEFDEIECNSDIDIMNAFITDIKNIEVFGNVKKNNKELNKKLDKIQIEIKEKTEKQKKREKTIFEKKNLTSSRLREIINEILSQMVNRDITEKLIDSNIRMNFRGLSGQIKFFDELITYGKHKASEFDEQSLYRFDEVRKIAIVNFAASLYEISNNLSPVRYHKYTYDYLDEEYNNNISNLIRQLLSLRINREKNDTTYYDPIIYFRDKMLKEKNYICALLINFAISNEINFIDVKENKKRVLLEKINAKDLSKSSSNPKSSMEQSNKNREIRNENIRKRMNRK